MSMHNRKSLYRFEFKTYYAEPVKPVKVEAIRSTRIQRTVSRIELSRSRVTYLLYSCGITKRHP